jgi:hypothetical protein
MFSEALAGELEGTGIQVQALCPGFTHTAFHDTPDFREVRIQERVPSFLWTTPEIVVDRSLADLKKGKVVCIPTLRYRLIAGAYRNRLARLLVRAISRLMLKRRDGAR